MQPVKRRLMIPALVATFLAAAAGPRSMNPPVADDLTCGILTNMTPPGGSSSPRRVRVVTADYVTCFPGEMISLAISVDTEPLPPFGRLEPSLPLTGVARVYPRKPLLKGAHTVVVIALEIPCDGCAPVYFTNRRSFTVGQPGGD